MSKKRFYRMLSVMLSVVCILQMTNLPVFAGNVLLTAQENVVDASEEGIQEVIIPKNSSHDIVNQKLSETLLGSYNGEEWEYYCEGKFLFSTNSAWGSIEGFQSTTGKGFSKKTFQHSSLAGNEDGIYSVRNNGIEYIIQKSEKASIHYVTNDMASQITLYHDDEGNMDYDAIENAIFEAVFESADFLTLEDVSVTYYSEPVLGTVGNLGTAWLSIRDEKTGMKPFTYGNQKIRVEWPGNDQYFGVKVEKEIEFTKLPEAEYELSDEFESAKLVYVYDENGQLIADYDAVRTNVFQAIGFSSDVLKAEDAIVTYYAEAVTGAIGTVGKAWMPMEGGKENLLQYKAMGAGLQTIRMTWPATRTYAQTTVEVTVEIKDREALKFQLKEDPNEVSIVFKDVNGYDYLATKDAILDAVLESTEPQISYDEIEVTYNSSIVNSDFDWDYKALDDLTNAKKFGEGTWTVKLSWNGNLEYAPAETKVTIIMIDNRIPSTVVMKEDAKFVYNMDVNVMKQNILDYAIDWENSQLPDNQELSIDDFTFEYLAQLSVLDGATGDVANNVIDSILGNEQIQKAYVPFEGKTYEAFGQILGKYPQIGAGEQLVKVSYKGDAQYKPGIAQEQAVTVEKAKVKVNVKNSSMTVSQLAGASSFITTNPEDSFDTYVIYSGVTSSVGLGIYMELPEKLTANSNLIKVLDKVLAGMNQPTFTEMLRNGITVGELKNLVKVKEFLDILNKFGVDTGAFGKLINVIDKLPSVTDNVRIGFGKPGRAGVYTITAVCTNRNYNTGVGVGVLVAKADKATLSWNQYVPKKLSVKDVAAYDFGASILVDGTVVKDQSSVKIVYTGITSKFRPYVSTEVPTEPGRYTQNITVIGGNYLATPIIRSFQITK